MRGEKNPRIFLSKPFTTMNTYAMITSRNKNKPTERQDEMENGTSAIEFAKTFANNTSSGARVTELVEVLYWQMVARGMRVSVMNHRYIVVETNDGEVTVCFKRDTKNRRYVAYVA